MDICIIVFPGTNREQDMALALTRVFGTPPRFIWHKETDIGNPDLIVLAGGFSHGDYLRCGAMAARAPVMQAVIQKAIKGTRVLGVCNGFQILVETGLLSGALLRNKTLRFACRQVYLKCENTNTDFTRHLTPHTLIHVPVAHGEGAYFVDSDTHKRMQDHAQIAFGYCTHEGAYEDSANFNGTIAHIAGVFNKEKTILGMMPHPENAALPWHANQSGLGIFESLRESLCA